MKKKSILICLSMMIVFALIGCYLYEDFYRTPKEDLHQPKQDEVIKTIPQSDENSYLILVNRSNRLDADYQPSDLVLLNVFDFNQNPNTTIHMRATAAQKAEEMFQAAWDQEGLLLLARSGYRSYQTQTQVHERLVNERGRVEAERISARPGHSEHQTGLALDVTANSVRGQLVESFSETLEGTWLRHHAHQFGFIISYPRGREEDTGFVYEPWHIRYVGVEVATIIYENGWILEEYLAKGGGL